MYYVFTETNFAKTFQECLSKVIDGLRKQNFLCFALRKNNFALAKKDVKDIYDMTAIPNRKNARTHCQNNQLHTISI